MNTKDENNGRPEMGADQNERKIIQIAAAVCDDYGETLYALCNDGTVWEQLYCPRRWKKLPPISLTDEGFVDRGKAVDVLHREFPRLDGSVIGSVVEEAFRDNMQACPHSKLVAILEKRVKEAKEAK